MSIILCEYFKTVSTMTKDVAALPSQGQNLPSGPTMPGAGGNCVINVESSRNKATPVILAAIAVGISVFRSYR